jgi:hypothetical protein
MHESFRTEKVTNRGMMTEQPNFFPHQTCTTLDLVALRKRVSRICPFKFVEFKSREKHLMFTLNSA